MIDINKEQVREELLNMAGLLIEKGFTATFILPGEISRVRPDKLVIGEPIPHSNEVIKGPNPSEWEY